MSNITFVVCSNCGKELGKGQRDNSECAECSYHAANGTRTISEYNKWLKKQSNRR
jgi:ribosomal protein L37E